MARALPAETMVRSFGITISFRAHFLCTQHVGHPIDSSLPDVSKYFGSDSTGGGIGFQFRQIKADAKRQRECYDAGGDPKDLNIGGKGADYFLLCFGNFFEEHKICYASHHCINGSQLLPVIWATARPVLLLSTGSVLSKRQPQRCELVELVHFLPLHYL